MSIKIMTQVWDSAVPAPERFTLLALADSADDNGVCWPAVSSVARKCGTHPATIRRHLNSLTAMGCLTVEHRLGNSSRFRIDATRFPQDDQPLANCDPSQIATPTPRNLRDHPSQIASPHPSQIAGTPPADCEPPPLADCEGSTPSRVPEGSQSVGGRARNLCTDPPTNCDPNRKEPPKNRHDPSRPDPQADPDQATGDTPKTGLKPEPDRDDVRQLCEKLRDRIVANGGRATITRDWRRAARLLLDQDKRDLDKALSLVDWCQNDQFWQANVLSMPTFRKQYDRLRLRALAEWEQGNRNPLRMASGEYRPWSNPTDPDAYDQPLLAPNPPEKP
jgi:hypothetical protein